jgi:hypothetical protein
VHFVVQAVAEEFTGTRGGLGGAEDLDGGDAELDYAGAGGIVWLEAMCGTLGAAHGVDTLDLFDWLAHTPSPTYRNLGLSELRVGFTLLKNPLGP